MMISQIRRGILDFIGAARPSIADPFMPKKIAEGRIEDIRECIGCNICLACENSFVPIRCTQNPTMMEEGRSGWHPEIVPSRRSDDSVLIVGGGPAGLECALSLARRGHHVTLAEARDTFGGRVSREASLPGIAAWGRVRDYRLGQLRKLPNVDLYPASRMNVDDVLGFGASRVVIATGSKWRPASLQRDGICRAIAANEVLTPDDIMDGQTPQGRILVHDTEGGYMGGLIAERLQRCGAAVAFSTPALTHSGFLALTLEQDRVLRRLTSLGVMMISSRELSGLENGQATLGSILGADPLTLEIDKTVLVADRIPIDGLAKQLQSDPERLRDAGIRSVDSVGDCVAPGLIAHAVYAAHRLALSF
jgi:dimethylamine/trimethylamine dehydrogenase